MAAASERSLSWKTSSVCIFFFGEFPGRLIRSGHRGKWIFAISENLDPPISLSSSHHQYYLFVINLMIITFEFFFFWPVITFEFLVHVFYVKCSFYIVIGNNQLRKGISMTTLCHVRRTVWKPKSVKNYLYSFNKINKSYEQILIFY